MRRYLPLLIALTLLILSSCGGSKKEVSSPSVSAEEIDLGGIGKPEAIEDRYAYVYGYQLASQFASGYPDSDSAYVLKGVYDALCGASYFSDAEASQILIDYRAKVQEATVRHLRAESEENLAAAEAFLKTNLMRTGVRAYNDKLQYEILREGRESGASPLSDSVVTVDYQIMTLEGDIKDSSYERGYPSLIALSSTIEGFKIMLTEMKEGEKVRAWIHPDLGYGRYGNSAIGPSQLLIFDIELISVEE